MEARGEQIDNQDKSELQGKIQHMYQQLCATSGPQQQQQQQCNNSPGPTIERKPPACEPVSVSGGGGGGGGGPVRFFSSFKTGRGIDPRFLELASLNLGHREYGSTQQQQHTERYQPHCYQQQQQQHQQQQHQQQQQQQQYHHHHQQQEQQQRQEPSPEDPEPRQHDKQSYFFHGHKTEKELDRELMGLGPGQEESSPPPGVNTVSSINCFGSTERHTGDGSSRRPTASGGTVRPHSGNVEFTEKEGEIFRKSSAELLQEASSLRRRNFSFRGREKSHRSLESLDRSLERGQAPDARSLDLLPDERSRRRSAKHKSLDSRQRKPNKSSGEQSCSRPNIFQRIGRSLNFLAKDRGRSPKREEARSSTAAATSRNELDFFGRGSSRDEGPAPLIDIDADTPAAADGSETPCLEQQQQLQQQQQQQLMMTEPSADASSNSVGNKDSLEIGYSISQLGRLQKQQQLQLHQQGECGESWERCLGWINKVDLDALSHSTNSSDSLGHSKPQGKLDILKGILLDIFVCICI